MNAANDRVARRVEPIADLNGSRLAIVMSLAEIVLLRRTELIKTR
jgi:hypothetical protein